MQNNTQKKYTNTKLNPPLKPLQLCICTVYDQHNLNADILK